MFRLCLVLLSILIANSLAAPAEDLVTDLPGLTWKPNFQQYSGYLDTERTRHLHYWFVESSNNPKTDPVVVWMNGGPGCSSLDGMLSEHGPFRVQDDGKTVKPNPFAWNQVANMIYLEAPAGVGFSYADDRNYTTDDDEVARNNHLAIKAFFKKFPEYQSHDFYISGESYGGIYVPTLASDIMDDPSINLKGFIVGNGLSDNSLNDNSVVYFAYYHGLIGQTKWNGLLDACCPNLGKGSCNFTDGARESPKCAEGMGVILNLVWGSGINVYNLYAECAGEDHTLKFDKESKHFTTSHFIYPFSSMKVDESVKTLLSLVGPERLKSSPPCVDASGMAKYLNTKEVRDALHIPVKVQSWDICSSIVGAGYHRKYTSMTAQYQKALDHKLRVMVYNGDVDMACNFLGDEWFVDSLHAQDPQERKMWNYVAADGSKQVAGFFKAFDHLTFVTVRGAGHMVPSDKPRPALKMFVSFVQNKPLN